MIKLAKYRWMVNNDDKLKYLEESWIFEVLAVTFQFKLFIYLNVN